VLYTAKTAIKFVADQRLLIQNNRIAEHLTSLATLSGPTLCTRARILRQFATVQAHPIARLALTCF